MKHIKFKHFNSAKNESNSEPIKAKERLRSLSLEVKKLRRRRLIWLSLLIFAITFFSWLLLINYGTHTPKSRTGNQQVRN